MKKRIPLRSIGDVIAGGLGDDDATEADPAEIVAFARSLLSLAAVAVREDGTAFGHDVEHAIHVANGLIGLVQWELTVEDCVERQAKIDDEPARPQ